MDIEEMHDIIWSNYPVDEIKRVTLLLVEGVVEEDPQSRLEFLRFLMEMGEKEKGGR